VAKHKKNRSKKSQELTAFSLHFQRCLREGFLLLTVTASLFFLLALLTYHHSDPSWSHFVVSNHVANATGRAGAWFSDFALYLFGYSAYLFPIVLSYAVFLSYRRRYEREDNRAVATLFFILKSAGFFLILVAGSGFLDLYVYLAPNRLPFDAGGILGNAVSTAALGAFNLLGASLVLLAVLFMGLTLFSGISWLRLIEVIGGGIIAVSQWCYYWFAERDWSAVFRAFSQIFPKPKSEKIPHSLK